MSLWIYFLGERTGRDIKIGYTSSPVVRSRVAAVNGEQTTNDEYLCLAAVVGDRKDEARLHRIFADLQLEKGRKREYFQPAPELVEYVAWLRGQYWTSLGDDDRSVWEQVPPESWMPDGEGRRMAAPAHKFDQIVQDWESIPGPLQGTPWAWMPNPTASFQDYFTPSGIIEAARRGMGGIDLDAASHWAANRVHRIPKYFHAGFSAFDHEWEGRVWLNPPYGNNGPWWDCVVHYIRSGQVEQICILSPVWAFTTQRAGELMRLANATILLTPTPTFWGNADGRTGTNLPHAIVYIGDRVSDVLAEFEEFGIPMEIGVRAHAT